MNTIFGAKTIVREVTGAGALIMDGMDGNRLVPPASGQRSVAPNPFRHNRQPRLPPWSAVMRRLLLAVVALIFASGCRAPLFHKEQHFTVYQYGVNTVTSELLKEEDISPQFKASLK